MWKTILGIIGTVAVMAIAAAIIEALMTNGGTFTNPFSSGGILGGLVASIGCIPCWVLSGVFTIAAAALVILVGGLVNAILGTISGTTPVDISGTLSNMNLHICSCP